MSVTHLVPTSWMPLPQPARAGVPKHRQGETPEKGKERESYTAIYRGEEALCPEHPHLHLGDSFTLHPWGRGGVEKTWGPGWLMAWSRDPQEDETPSHQGFLSPDHGPQAVPISHIP